MTAAIIFAIAVAVAVAVAGFVRGSDPLFVNVDKSQRDVTAPPDGRNGSEAA